MAGGVAAGAFAPPGVWGAGFWADVKMPTESDMLSSRRLQGFNGFRSPTKTRPVPVPAFAHLAPYTYMLF